MKDFYGVPVPTPSMRIRGSRPFAGALMAFFLCAGGAAAKCQDAPGAGVDWSGCSKARLMLTGEDLTGTIFQRSLLTLSDFASSKMAGANLSETEISRTRFEGADLSRAD